jgi:hypothetical protein
MVKCLAKRLIFSRSSGIGDASLITVWSEVRILPGPPRTPALNEISCCLPNSRDFARVHWLASSLCKGEELLGGSLGPSVSGARTKKNGSVLVIIAWAPLPARLAKAGSSSVSVLASTTTKRSPSDSVAASTPIAPGLDFDAAFARRAGEIIARAARAARKGHRQPD